MYGSIRKSYGAKKASRVDEKRERKVLFGKKNKTNTKSTSNFEETSYINVEANTKNTKSTRVNAESFQQNTDKNNVGKNEFPIASVILTIVFTMMIMVLAFGFGV